MNKCHWLSWLCFRNCISLKFFNYSLISNMPLSCCLWFCTSFFFVYSCAAKFMKLTTVAAFNRSLKCSGFTWVLFGHDWLLLQDISHVPIQRSLWRATVLGGQIFHWVDVYNWENTGTPTNIETENFLTSIISHREKTNLPI